MKELYRYYVEDEANNLYPDKDGDWVDYESAMEIIEQQQQTISELEEALEDLNREMLSIRASYFCDPINTFGMDKAQQLLKKLKEMRDK